MSMSNAFETDVLNHIFNNTAIALIGDAAGLLPSTVAGSLYVSLHTGDPGEAGNQGSNETVYTNYGRVAVARTAGAWVVSGNTVSNVSLVQFPQCGATGATITYVGVGVSPTAGDTGKLLFSGNLSASLTVANLIQPQFAAGDIDIVAD